MSIFEPIFSYALCKQLDGTLGEIYGTTALWGNRVIKAYGLCPKKYFKKPNFFNNKQYLDFLAKPIPKKF